MCVCVCVRNVHTIHARGRHVGKRTECVRVLARKNAVWGVGYYICSLARLVDTRRDVRARVLPFRSTAVFVGRTDERPVVVSVVRNVRRTLVGRFPSRLDVVVCAARTA